MKAARSFVHIDTQRLMRRGGELIVLSILAACFVAGAVAGALAGSGELPAGENILPGDGSIYGYGTYAGLLFNCAKYHLIVLLFSTSLLGGLLIPATLAFRGFALSCSAAWMAEAYPETGIALALIALGLPALLTVPSLFVAAQSGELFSLRLLAGFTRRPIPAHRATRDNRALAVAIMLFAAAALERFVVPPLVELIM